MDKTIDYIAEAMAPTHRCTKCGRCAKIFGGIIKHDFKCSACGYPAECVYDLHWDGTIGPHYV